MTEGLQYVTLGVDREVFAIPVANVQEILDMQPIARLPHAPDYLLGIIDVRGRGVPVIDLRTKIGLPVAEATASTRILVIEVEIEQRALLLGLVADRVFEVTGLDNDQVEPPPEIGRRWRSDSIKGVGRRRSEFVVVFDIVKLIAADALDLLATADAPLAA
ncbi:MAG: chemotaxis protein CheW [Rhodospirillales bacterium]